MKRYQLSTFLILWLISPLFSNAQVAINTTNTPPAGNAMLDVNSTNKGILFPRIADPASIPSPANGLMFFNTTSNKFNFFNGANWQDMNSRWTLSGTSIYYNTGNVGINTPNPIYKLQVTGTSYFNGFVGINDDLPDWELDVNGKGSITNFGINGAAPNTTYPLDVQGDTRVSGKLATGTITASGNVDFNGNADVAGTLKVNNGHGVAYNERSAANLKIYRFTTTIFHAVLGSHASSTSTISFGGGFTSAPTVLVGDIDYTGGTAGELDRVILVLRACTTTGCLAKLVNTDNSPVDYNVSWNCVAIGY